MKFAVASEHRDFFNKNGYIEFAELVTDEQLKRLNEDVKQVLVNRLKLPSHASLDKQPSGSLFSKGRDLWRDLPSIKKVVCNPLFAEIAWELCQQRPLRIGYDQFFPSHRTEGLALTKHDTQQPQLSGTLSLAESCSIQGVISGFILCLKGDAQAETLGFFPTTPGHALFFSVDHPIDFAKLGNQCDYLLVTYAIKKSVYVHNEKDPLCYDLRQWGYTFGDALSDRLNPILLR